MDTSATAPAPESSGADAGPAPAKTGDGLNALQDSIRRRGKNSYYFAHENSRETVKNYGGEPQRVEPTPADAANLPVPKRKCRIPKYSWSDGKKTVKLYVPTDFAAGETVGDEHIDLQWTESSLTINVNGIAGKDHELRFDKLHDEISKATHRLKPDSLVVTLIKSTEISWYKLAA